MPKDVPEQQTTSNRIDPAAEKPSGPILSAVDAIIAGLDKEAGRPEVFAVMWGSKLLYFRRPKNSRELKIFEQAGRSFVIQMSNKTAIAKLPDHMRKALEFASDATEEDFVNAFTIHYWSVEPERITQAQAIKMTRNPVAMENIVLQINAEHAFGVTIMNLGGVTIAKKKSTLTSGGNARSARRSRTSAAGSRTS